MIATFCGYTVEQIKELEKDNKRLREMLTALDIQNNTLVQRNRDYFHRVLELNKKLKKGDK